MKLLNLISAGFVLSLVLATGAPGANNFTSTGNLSYPRYEHTATLLSNGKVLVTGGLYYDPSSEGSPQVNLNSAELYDPATGLWSPTGSLAAGRELHTATLLPNGKVLVAGGLSSGAYTIVLSSVELYDPATGIWSPTGGLASRRVGHTATLLPNGKVLFVGGASPIIDGRTVSSAELYDSATGAWSDGGNLVYNRSGHTATLLPNGRVLVAGGSGISSAELFNPVTGTWSLTGNLGAARSGHTATLLPNGRVLVAGGSSSKTEAVLSRSAAPNYTIPLPASGRPPAASAPRAPVIQPRCCPTAKCSSQGAAAAAPSTALSCTIRPAVRGHSPATSPPTATDIPPPCWPTARCSSPGASAT